MGPTTIYSPFYQTPMINYRSSEHPFFDLFSATGSGSHHPHSHIPRVTIHPQPRGSIFLTSCLGTHDHVQNYQIIVMCYLSSGIVHVGYLVFYVRRYSITTNQLSPFR
jgi:hypothetical protein